MDDMTLEDDNFSAWYSQLNKQERQQFNKEIMEMANRTIEKYFTSLPTIKDIDMGEPCTFTVEKFTNLSNEVYLRYKNKEE